MAQCGGNPSRYAATKPTEIDLVVVADCAGNNWSRLLAILHIPWTTIEKIRTESPTNLWEACMKGLVIWLKGGANEPVTFGTLFAALKDSEMADCVSLLVDRLDERSTPHPRPTHEDKDEDLSTPPSKRRKATHGRPKSPWNVFRIESRKKEKDTVTQLQEKHTQLQEKDTQLQEKDTQLQEKDTQLQEKNTQLQEKNTQLQEKDTQLQEKDILLQEKGALIAKLLQKIQRLEQNKPPRNWSELKCQKTLKCGGECYSVAVQGDVVYVGVGGRVLLFSKTSGAQVRELGSDQIKGPVWGVAFIDEDTIVVSDDKRLRMYTTKGQLVRTFDSGKDGFGPLGLTVGPDGHVFVCDWNNHCVCVFNVDGKLLSSFGSEGSGVGQFKGPWDLCMDGEGLLFISDYCNSRICVHSVEGAFIREFPTPRQPTCVAATHCNHLVVSTYLSHTWSLHTVMIMTTSGQLVHEFGEKGRGPGQFKCPGPQGVAVDNEDCVYVCDGDNKRVQVY